MANLADFDYLVEQFPDPAPPPGRPAHLRVVGEEEEGPPPDPATVRSALMTLAPTKPEADWWLIVMAVRSAMPGQDGYDLVDAWSSQAREDAGQTTSLRADPTIWRRVNTHSVTWTHLFRLAIDEGNWQPHKGFNLIVKPPIEADEEREAAAHAADTAAYPPLDRAEMPHFLGLMVDHLAPVTVAWRNDWGELLALASISGCLPAVTFENLGVNLWFLGLAKQELGKSRSLTEARRVTQDTNAQLGLAMQHVSSATLEGYARVLKGDRTIIYAEHHEYGAMLQVLARDYNHGIKGMLCALYDGEDYSYQRSREAVEFTRPYMTVCAATHQKTLARTMPIEDLSNGYMSRFLICSPPYRLGAKIGYRTDRERAALTGALAEHLRPYAHTDLAAGWLIPSHTPFHIPPAIRDYQAALGLTETTDTAIYYEMETALDEEDATETPGRCLARALKVATLLELLSDAPNVSGGQVHVRDHHAALAVRLVARAAGYGRRMAARIGQPEDAALAGRIKNLLKLRAKTARTHGAAAGMTERELCQTLRVTKRQLDPAMYLLEQDGALMQYQVGKAIRHAILKGVR